MRINHFRGWEELCRKDKLNKNLKKYKRGLDKQNNKEESDEYDFLPATFYLPSEYVIFYEEFKKTQHDNRSLWIMKPVNFPSFRPANVKERAFSSLVEWVTCRGGSLSIAITHLSPMCASAT